MEEELKYHLQQGPQTIKNLVRLTGKTDSGIRKAVANIEGVVEGKNGEGHKTFALPPQGDAPAEKPTSQPTAAPAAQPTQPEAAPVAGKRGRKAAFAGKKLTATKTENTRRAGSHGYRSLQIIIDHPGISTELFVAEGGRLNDLRWDIEHGNVKAS